MVGTRKVTSEHSLKKRIGEYLTIQFSQLILWHGVNKKKHPFEIRVFWYKKKTCLIEPVKNILLYSLK